MTATIQRLLHIRFGRRRHLYYLHHFFSFSSDSSDIPPAQLQSNPKPSFTSSFSNVRANIQRQPPPQKPLPSPQTPQPSKTNYFEEVRRNLAEFRSRSAVLPPSAHHDHSATSSNSPVPAGRSVDSIKESVRYLLADSNSERNLGNALNLKSGPNASLESPAIGGGSGGLLHFLGKENIRGKDDNSPMRRHKMRTYTYSELGSKLKTLRPEKKKGKGFTLLELNERLAKLREIEEKENQSIVGGVTWRDLRDTIVQLDASEKVKNKTVQRLDLLGQLDETSSYLMNDPKDYLVEKYFHPDNMSSAEKLKMELKRVRDEFKMSESDCGSARVQVALLTTKIKHLSTVLHKKDKHSRRGLQAMVQRRKKLLKYLRRSDWDSYCLVLSSLVCVTTQILKHRQNATRLVIQIECVCSVVNYGVSSHNRSHSLVGIRELGKFVIISPIYS